ncbi:hypothetical protein BDM02DRAFT_492334 [Thelephora ganbajun]|uniref:Uncharacterized protein n=1 Tax=Thelephora ganbajun TaxID=370292 RepID=A0ACB6Z8L1_THEGA|nr:hypothetical protein BDM02DRAFT_492334 [Thelephora ganbajun]
MRPIRLFSAVHILGPTRSRGSGHVSYNPRYTTPTTLLSANVCNPIAPTTARLLGVSSHVAARLTVGPLPRLWVTASLRVLVLVSLSCSRYGLAEPEAADAEREPRFQTRDKDPSTSATVLSSRLPLDIIKVYAQVVPELASLVDHMERKSPILVISTTDTSMDSVLPFQLPSGYGCVVLGFFDVESVEVGSAYPSIPQAVSRF